MVKFTHAANDNGTIWYTVQVFVFIVRFLMRKRKSLGSSRRDIAKCVPFIKIARRPNGETTYLNSLLGNSSAIQVNSSSKNERNNSKTIIVLFLELFKSSNSPKFSSFSTPTSRSKKNKRQLSRPNKMNNMRNLKKSKSRWRKSLRISSITLKSKWSKATNSTTT